MEHRARTKDGASIERFARTKDGASIGGRSCTWKAGERCTHALHEVWIEQGSEPS